MMAGIFAANEQVCAIIETLIEEPEKCRYEIIRPTLHPYNDILMDQIQRSTTVLEAAENVEPPNTETLSLSSVHSYAELPPEQLSRESGVYATISDDVSISAIRHIETYATLPENYNEPYEIASDKIQSSNSRSGDYKLGYVTLTTCQTYSTLGEQPGYTKLKNYSGFSRHITNTTRQMKGHVSTSCIILTVFCSLFAILCSIAVSYIVLNWHRSDTTHLLLGQNETLPFVFNEHNTSEQIFLQNSKVVACKNQIEVLLNEWLNSSHAVIKGYAADEDKALQCQQFTPIPHDILQTILDAYKSIDNNCKIYLKNINREMNIVIDIQSEKEFNAASHHQLLLNNCFKKTFCPWSRLVVMRSFLSSNTTITRLHLTNGVVKGVTVVDDKLYLVQGLVQGQQTVNVHEMSSLSSLPDKRIPDIIRPVGLAGCSFTKALYIIDSKLKDIHTVNITDNSVKRWSVRENYEPKGLSVTTQHNILVTVRNSGPRTVSKIVEYSSEGDEIREIELDASINYAHLTMELSTDRFIIAQGEGDSLKHRVCVIDSVGHLLKCFGNERGEGEDGLYWPSSLTIDKKKEFIFVSDWGNDRIIMLDYNMNYLGVIRTPDDFLLPSSLYFDSDSQQLFVGEGWNSRRLLIIGPDRSA